MKRTFKIVLPILLIALAAGAFAYLSATDPEATPSPAQEEVRPVSTVVARFVDIRPTIVEFGSVVAGSVVELRPPVAGRIVEVGPNFREGGVVRKGETLLVVDRFDYEVAVADREAAVAESEARLREARDELTAQRRLLAIAEEQAGLRMTDLERKRELSSSGTLSRKSHDDARIAYNEASRSVETYRQGEARLAAKAEQVTASLARSRAALERARRDLADTLLVAPEDGYVAGVAAAAGQRVGSNDRLGRLIVARRLEVSFQLKQDDFAHLAGGGGPGTADRILGRPVSVEWRVAQQSYRLEAVIERLGAEIDPASGGIEVHARLVDFDLRTPLRSGAFVEVSIPGSPYRNVLRLPESVIDIEGNIHIVEGGRLAPRPVELLRRVSGDVLVRADVPEGAQIVTTQFPEIGPGLRVEVR